jgi:hypothetical protein
MQGVVWHNADLAASRNFNLPLGISTVAQFPLFRHLPQATQAALPKLQYQRTSKLSLCERQMGEDDTLWLFLCPKI